MRGEEEDSVFGTFFINLDLFRVVFLIIYWVNILFGKRIKGDFVVLKKFCKLLVLV